MALVSMKWLNVQEQVNGCKFVQEKNAFLTTNALYLCQDEWKQWSANLKDMALVTSLEFGGITLVPLPGETFYAPWETMAAQLDVQLAAKVEVGEQEE